MPSNMIDQEIARLRKRMDDLDTRILPDLQRKSDRLYPQIMVLPKDSEERTRLESEFELLSKELRLRSDEFVNLRQQVSRLEAQKRSKRR